MRKALLALVFSAVLNAAEPLERQFQNPPDSERPWVYWFTLNENCNRKGVTANFEAMAWAGIGSVISMEGKNHSISGRLLRLFVGGFFDFDLDGTGLLCAHLFPASGIRSSAGRIF